MLQVVKIVPKVMEHLGAMGTAIGLMINVFLYNLCTIFSQLVMVCQKTVIFILYQIVLANESVQNNFE